MHRYFALAVFLAVPAQAGEPPTYESMGFLVTHMQLSVVNSADVQERSPPPTLTQAGMPASLHQLAVLTPRPQMTDAPPAAALTKAQLSVP